MKKTNTMRVAVLLLALALVTSCFVGGTFAKYTATATGGDKARVAYWGFHDTTIEIKDLFDYTDEGVYNDGDVEGLIAPGTTNTKTFAFNWVPDAPVENDAANGITGFQNAPEVDYNFTVAVEASCADAIKNNPNIIWYLDDVACDSFDDLVADIKTLSGEADGTKEYEAGTLPTGFDADDEHTIKWVWLFETADDADPDNGSEMAAQDITDTLMGNTTTPLEVSLAITVTATQTN